MHRMSTEGRRLGMMGSWDYRISMITGISGSQVVQPQAYLFHLFVLLEVLPGFV